jgi:hypothetical protein
MPPSPNSSRRRPDATPDPNDNSSPNHPNPIPTPGRHIAHPKLRGEWAELRFLQRAIELGFRVTKPWGETAPYDVATDHRGLFLRVQVKCTLYRRGNSYVCTICSSHVIYTPDQLDFFAALVIPTNTWYILPIRATHNQPTIVLSPHLKKSKYSQYQEAWHLLTR